MVKTMVLKGQRGFTLIELMAVIAILTVLAGIVAGGVTGLGASGQAAKITGDKNTIGKAANRFASDAFPEAYPTKRPVDLVTAPNDCCPTVGVIDFNATLPQDPTRRFVPKYLTQVPDSAGLVSWRIDTATGNVFAADDAAKLILPSTNELDISTPTAVFGVSADYTVELRMKKNEAALRVLKVEIPAGYNIGGASIPTGTSVGFLKGVFATDNPWDTGQKRLYTGTLRTTLKSHEWQLTVNYDANCIPIGTPATCVPSTTAGTTGSASTNVKNTATAAAADSRTHTVKISTPTAEVGGQMVLTMDRGADPDQNEATETFTLTLCGKANSLTSAITCPATTDATLTTIIDNPDTEKVYRWLAKEHTAIDSVVAQKQVFNAVVGGNQAVVIK